MSQSSEQLLQQAVAQHQAGRANEAKRLYQTLLQQQPNHPEANHNLGVLAVQSGQAAAGLPHFLAALEADPARAQFWLSYIDALLQAGQHDAAHEVIQIARQQGLQGEEIEALAVRASGGQVQPGKQQQAPGARENDALAALFNSGRVADTVAQARQMTAQFPQHGFGWKVLGLALKQMGRNEEAIAPMQKAAALLPKEADAHSNLGVALQDAGRLQEAEASYRRALKLAPGYADAHCNLGTLLQETGRLAEAEASYRRAVQLAPNLADAHYNLGNTLRESGRLAEAEASYRRALKLRPAYVQACCNLGSVLHDEGKLAEAETTLRHALELKPDHVEALGNLGNTLKELGRLGEAESNYRHALQLKPDQAEVSNNLGILLQGRGALEEAASCFRRALQLKPDLVGASNNLGTLLQDMGALDEAEASYRRALQQKPAYFKAHSNLLLLFNYNPAIAPETAFAEARRFGESVAAQVTAPFRKWSCAKQSPRLRIGFVSGDFRNHPVGYFLENLLKHLDGGAFELYAYPTDTWEDDLTLRLRSYFAAWKPLVGLNDKAAAQLIHGDGIHILIDLSGHSRNNRLPVFAWKPAPVQVAWLGYFATTGVAEMDYLIADAATLPESEEKYFTEKIWRLPETRLCFTPPDVEVEVSPLPALANGYLTFGCFNNLAKMNDAVVALWSRVLAAVPESRLFLKSKQLGDAIVRDKTIARFAAHGVTAERLILEGAESREKYFEAYHRVDIALDPFPFPGGTTTVESLWMGVPVLNLSGESFLFRQGAGFLSNAGLPDWVATTPEDYVAKAVARAADVQGLAALRGNLRRKIETSPIMDGRRFAAHFGAALQEMWRNLAAN